jgi:hypothetical protein
MTKILQKSNLLARMDTASIGVVRMAMAETRNLPQQSVPVALLRTGSRNPKSGSAVFVSPSELSFVTRLDCFVNAGEFFESRHRSWRSAVQRPSAQPPEPHALL